MTNVDVSVKNIIYMKKILFGILPHLYLASIIDNLVITCDEITEPEAQSYDKETKEL